MEAAIRAGFVDANVSLEQKMTRAQAAEVIMKLLDFWEKERQQFLENMKKK
jgi:hypothetical protein